MFTLVDKPRMAFQRYADGSENVFVYAKSAPSTAVVFDVFRIPLYMKAGFVRVCIMRGIQDEVRKVHQIMKLTDGDVHSSYIDVSYLVVLVKDMQKRVFKYKEYFMPEGEKNF